MGRQGTISALNHMIENDLSDYHCDPWSGKEKTKHYVSVEDLKHQVNYKSEIFFIVKREGGGCGMGEYPPSAEIYRINIPNSWKGKRHDS